MPTKIVIASGMSAGTEFWIEETVSRIGSDPHCQLCIADPDLAPHIATLEFRGGEFLLHNRRDSPLVLEGREIPPRGSVRWTADQVLQLTEALTLRLETSGDPTPCPRPVAAFVDESEPPPFEDEGQAEPDSKDGQPAAGAGGRSKNTLPIIVTVFCVVVGGLMLIADPSSQESAPVRNVPQEFEKLIVDLGKEKAPAGLDTNEVREALQAARIAELRGDKQRAQDYYGYLRDLLLTRRQKDGTFPSELEKSMWEFVGGQLRSRSSTEGEQGM